MYVDDILISSPDLISHLEHVQRIFDLLQLQGLSINTDRCTFAASTVDYHSMRVSESGCFPLVKHTESIPAFPSLAARSIQLLGPSGVYSKKLSASESRYSAFDHEMFAAYSSLCHFHFLLKGKDFVLFTVHKPWSAMQQCRLSFLSKFNCDVCHLTGAENVVADALSCPDPTHSSAVPNSPCSSDA